MRQLGKIQFKELNGLDFKYFNALLSGIYGEMYRLEKVGLMLHTEKIGFYFKLRLTEFVDNELVYTDKSYDGVAMYNSENCYFVMLTNDGINQEYFIHEHTLLSSMPLDSKKEYERYCYMKESLALVFRLAHEEKTERYNFDIYICKKMIYVWESTCNNKNHGDFSQYTYYKEHKVNKGVVKSTTTDVAVKTIIKPVKSEVTNEKEYEVTFDSKDAITHIVFETSKYDFDKRLYRTFNN